ncbi:MAG: hypothetical protein FWG23_02135 [Eggerthellaceae bacterium]|jgi:hypothetical protein|nr:hypothetical protein [Eggerthellaceae bacterium]MDR2715221.1 antitoxin [Coriobacteriaceae bacterium]
MPQVSLYLDQEVLDTAKRNARIKNLSFSKYVSAALTRTADSGWPYGYWELFGALDDDSFIRGADVPFDSVAVQAKFS